MTSDEESDMDCGSVCISSSVEVASEVYFNMDESKFCWYVCILPVTSVHVHYHMWEKMFMIT